MVWAEHIATNIKMKKFKDPHQILQVWFSSSFPIGSYAYSHGLEALIDEKKIENKDDVKEFLDALLFYGTLRNDYIFIKSLYNNDEINELILASASTKERKIEMIDHCLLELKKNEYKVNLPKGQIFKEALHRTG